MTIGDLQNFQQEAVKQLMEEGAAPVFIFDQLADLCLYYGLPHHYFFYERRRVTIQPGGHNFPWIPFDQNPQSVMSITAHLADIYRRAEKNELIPDVLYRRDEEEGYISLKDQFAEGRSGRGPSSRLRAEIDRSYLGNESELRHWGDEWTFRDLRTGDLFLIKLRPDTDERGPVLVAMHGINGRLTELRWRPKGEPTPLPIHEKWPLRVADLCEAVKLVVTAI